MSKIIEIYRKIADNIWSIKQRLGHILQPITTPIKRTWSPINTKYLELTNPIRTWHANLAKSSPILASTVMWSYKIFRYGINTLLVLILLSLFGVFGHMPSRTDLKNIENSNTTEIYSQDSVLIGRFFIENRTEITLDKMSPYVITALLAVEDKRFFEHSGIDLRSWFRVFKGLATNKSGMGGGSTLSQQLAKNLYPRKNYFIPGISLLINKIRENIISIKLESIYNKEELLSLYLNTVPFGGDRFGINVASKYFYNKKAKDLTAPEAAALIGMLKATTALDPTRNPKNSQKRRNLVLKVMHENSNFQFQSGDLQTVTKHIANGKLSKAEYEEMVKKPVGAKKYSAEYDSDGKGAYFREYLRTTALPRILKTLLKEDGSMYNFYRDGLKIYTTIDSRLQGFGEDAVRKHMKTLQNRFYKHWKGVTEEKPWGDDKWIEEQIVKSERYKLAKENGATDEEIKKQFDTKTKMTVFSWNVENGGDKDTLMTPRDSVIHYFTMLNTGFMAMDHSNGYIKSWVGGTNFKYFKYDHILSKRQVGSTFKPIVYAGAIRDSIKPCDFFKNEQITVGDWSPRNSDQEYGGWVSVQGGITYSINTIAAQLIQYVGIQKTLDLAAKMGITSPLPREFGIALGAADITLYEMMKVYGTMANKGVRPEPVSVLRIVDRNGKVIYDYEENLKTNPNLGPHEQALTEDEAAIMTRLLQSVIDQGTGNKFRASGAVGEYAGKTGTTQNHSDGWFMVYNPYLVSGAWVGAPSPAVRFRDMDLGQGSAMALPIVAEFWKGVRGDNKWKKITDTKFEENKTAINLVGCALRIGIDPDTLDLLMQDTFYKQQILDNHYRDLKLFKAMKFNENVDSNEMIKLGEYVDPDDEKTEKENKKDSKKPDDGLADKAIINEKSKDKKIDPKQEKAKKEDQSLEKIKKEGKDKTKAPEAKPKSATKVKPDDKTKPKAESKPESIKPNTESTKAKAETKTDTKSAPIKKEN